MTRNIKQFSKNEGAESFSIMEQSQVDTTQRIRIPMFFVSVFFAMSCMSP